MAGANILIVEDNQDICEILMLHLQSFFEVDVVNHGSVVIEALLEKNYTAVLLDIMLPGVNGLDLCKNIRQTDALQDLAVVMLSAKNDENTVVKALELGADDYVAKPFRKIELLARIKNAIKKYHNTANIIEIAALNIDVDKRQFFVDAKEQRLTKTEFEILLCFMQNVDRIFTRDQLINKMHGVYADLSDRNIDVHITSLRKKMRPHQAHINTVRSIGYRFLSDIESV